MKKINKKVLITSLFIIVSIIIGVIIYDRYVSNKLIKDIKSHFSTNVIISANSIIYTKNGNNYVASGVINKKMNLVLSDIPNIDKNTKYFNIQNTDYYLFYKDLTPADNSIIKDDLSSIYLPFNSNVITRNNTIFYQNSENVFHINDSIDLPLLYQDDEYYYVKYWGKIYGISKNYSELKDNLNTDKISSEYISIIHYKNIVENGCNDGDCITISSIEDNLKFLQENKCYTISEEDYIKWISNKVRLEQKAILIVVDDDSLIKDLFNKYNYLYIKESDLESLKLNDSNKATVPGDLLESISSYLVREENSDDIIKKAINGEEYVYTKNLIVDFDNNDNNNGVANSIAVLNYHFFYDASKGQTCNESICLEASKFEEQLKYLKDNNYKTLTIDEFKSWMYGEIDLPKKSVLLTIDDGAMGTGINNGNVLIPLLEKYQVHATLFLISGWWSPNNYQSQYLDIQSHTSDMHREGYCNSESRGSQLLCSSYEEILADLTDSLNDVDSDTSFCFPFYAYNDKALKAIKEKGFKIAFVGGGYKATRSSDKYLIPRYVIYNNITLNQFINYIN